MMGSRSFRIKALMSAVIVAIVGISGLFFYNKINSYAQDYVAGESPKNISGVVRKLNVILSDYGIANRTILRDEPNETGLKITYRDRSWLYLDEYVNVKSDNSGISKTDISKIDGRTPKDIVGFELAAGYEATLVNGNNKTRIMGPLRLLGICENEYSGKSVNDTGGDFGGEREKSVEKTAEDLGFKGKSSDIKHLYCKLWDYNHAKCWSVPGDDESAEDRYNRNNVKIYEIKTIELKKTSLREGVYLMKDLYNVVNCPGERPFQYLGSDFGKGEEINLNDSSELEIGDIVNSLIVVGPYKVQIQRKKERTGRGQKKQQVEIVGQKGKIINLVNFWRLHADEGEAGPQITNDTLWIKIFPTEGSEKKDDTEFYNECVVFKEEDWNKIYRSKQSKKSLSRYDEEIKVCNIPTTKEDPAMTIYTAENFSGEYVKFYRGGTYSVYSRDIGEDYNMGEAYNKDIEGVWSLEIGSNTRVVFSDKEDCDLDNKDDVNYGKIKKSEGSKVLVLEGPCSVSNLKEYLVNCYTDGNSMLDYSWIDKIKSITVKAQKAENNDYLLYTKKNGVSVFCKGNFDGQNGKATEVKLGDYFPQSITINGDYFVKFYDKNNKLVKTLVGPLKNARVDLDKGYGELLDRLNWEIYESWTLESKSRDGIEKAKKESYSINNENATLEQHLVGLYNRYDNMTMRINSSTQRDKRGRSLENVDGIVLYQYKDYNQNVRAEENVWTVLRVDDGKFIWGGVASDFVKLVETRSVTKMEIDYRKIGSIKISGSLLGKYKIGLNLKDGTKFESRNSIKDLEKLIGTTEVMSISIDKIEDEDKFDILLSSPKGGSNNVRTSGINVSTTDVRVEKASDFVEGAEDIEKRIDREVYLIDILDVADKIGLGYEYVYKRDASGTDEDELVGVKFTRDIGVPEQSEKNKQIYKDIDDNVKSIVRDVEVKFNQDEESVSMALLGTKLPWGISGEANTSGKGEYISSDEYNQTKDSRSLIITDHGYLEDKTNIKNDSTVVVKNCRDVMEVPAMLIKEVTISIKSSSDEGDSSIKKKTYLEIAKNVEDFELTSEESKSDRDKNSGEGNKNDENKKEVSKLHLYIPASYSEGNLWHTSYILSQLGIKATNNGDKIYLSA